MSNTVPEGWFESRLDQFAVLQRGFDLPVQNRIHGDVPIYGSNGVVGYHNESSVKGPGVVTGRSGSIGDVLFVEKDFWALNTSLYIKDFHGNSCKYVYHYLDWFDLSRFGGGTGVPTLNRNDVHCISIVYPRFPEQQKIATILSSVDDVIEKTRAQIDKLKDIKTGMMQELLTKGIGHTEFKDSPVGRIPAGWEVKALGDVFALSSGSTPSRSVPEYYCSSLNAHSWVKTLDLSDGLIFKTDEKITDQAIQNSSCKVYPIGTALVAMYGGWNQIGRSGLLAIPAATNQAICALLSKGIVEGSYANYWLASERYRWKSIAASSRKDPNITKQDVSDFLITVPTLDEQKKIVIRLDNATELVDKKIKQLSFYNSIKKALMQDLLTGKVRVNLTDKESAVV